jgi:hypothetical protein
MANAQKSLLALNEHNKYIYYQVVDRPDVTADSLNNKAVAFVKENFPKIKSRTGTDTSISIRDKFETYSALSFARHESGQITYTLTIECKNFKYRFWLTDFVFTPFQRDRYGMFVPINGKDVPLENASNKLDKKELDGYFDQTGLYCEQLGEKLKLYMMQDHSVEKSQQAQSQQPIKKVVTDKW